MARTTTNKGAAQHAAPSFPFLTGKVAVTVTQEWIDRGRYAERLRPPMPRECNCPVSHALAAAGFENVRVMSSTFTSGPTMGDAPRRRSYCLPEAAQRFIERFDSACPAEPAEPFTFEVDADDYLEVLAYNDFARMVEWS